MLHYPYKENCGRRDVNKSKTNPLPPLIINGPRVGKSTSPSPLLLLLLLPRAAGELESVRIGKCQNAFFFKIGKCQNRKVSELESVRIGKCQNWKVSELESVRIGKC